MIVVDWATRRNARRPFLSPHVTAISWKARSLLLPVTRRKKPSKLDQRVLERQVRICKALANTTRLHMVDLLENGEWPASDLQRALSITKPNLSQHLAILKSAGMVATRREGKRIYCSLAMPEVKRVCHRIRDVLRAQIRHGHNLKV